MNCAKCGSALPPNAYFCPVCNAPTDAGQGYAYADTLQTGQYQPADAYGTQTEQGYAPQGGIYQPQQSGRFQAVGQGGAYQQPTQGAAYQAPQQSGAYGQPQEGAYQPQQSGRFQAVGQSGAYQQPAQGAAYQAPQQGGAYQQSYAQYGSGAYPPGYQPPYQYGQPDSSGATRFMALIAELPRTFVDSFTKPAEVLRRQMESHDHITGAAVAGAALLLSFLFGMAAVHGLVSALMGGFSSLTGVSLAGDAASFNQGVNYIAGKVAPGVGGIAALCRLISMVAPAAVVMVYLCVVCKARFSLDLLLGYITATALPSLVFLALMLVLSFVSPWLTLLPLICSWVVYIVQMGAIISFVTGRPEEALMLPKTVCGTVSIAVTALLAGVVGGALMGNVMQRVIILLANVGSLI